MTHYTKTHHRDNDSLYKEAAGLQALRETIEPLQLSLIKVPEVFGVSHSSLKLEKVLSRAASVNQMQAFGAELAQFHNVSQAQYGWHEDNFIGLSVQKNQLKQEWGEFFIEFRLMPQINMLTSHSLKERFGSILETHRGMLTDFLSSSCDFPSLLHGDLWSGNVLFDKHNAWLIDPAVYYGDSVADIAMTEMFGGFSREFYSHYRQIKPLTDDYPIKKQIYNLYHYLNHLNLFGSGYLAGCEQGFGVISNI